MSFTAKLSKYMSSTKNDGKEYENFTILILNSRYLNERLRDNFNLHEIHIKPEKRLPGKSGTKWKVDAYGYDINNRLVIVECKNYKSSIKQNIIAAFAYVIKDLGAYLGIFVAPCKLQYGAKQIADYENIEIIELPLYSTDKNFFIRYPLKNKILGIQTEECKTGLGYVSLNDKSETISPDILQVAGQRVKQRKNCGDVVSMEEIYAEAEIILQDLKARHEED
ncbi:MAG TPA: restriction endonuclease [Nostocaceae cyanobacterium]|nr:restriction endonuclease [Nostocaceae cyanobacterium]